MKNKIIFKDINKDLSSVKSKLFVCGFFKNDTLDKSLDKLLNGILSKTIKLESFKGDYKKKHINIWE